MKKFIKLLFFPSLVMSAFCLTAKPVDVNIAKSIGSKFMATNVFVNAKTLSSALSHTFILSDGTPCCYVFNVAEKGFVIVSADDLIAPIIGYSPDNVFNNEDISPELSYYINCFADKIEHMRTNNIPASKNAVEQWQLVQSTGNITVEKDSKTVSPLVRTQWNQDRYYNNLCPTDPKGPGGHVYAGCVACAMSQIMKYWNYPSSGVGSHSFTAGVYGSQSANFEGTYYNYENMPASLSRTSSQEEIFQVAQLMYHCGVSVNMMYSPDGSGAFSEDVPNSWKTYFQFDDATRFENMSSFSTDEWEEMLKNDLDKGYPLYYSGSSQEGGHAFVCDGYNNSGMFHFNWGWGGYGDGYFLTDSTFMFPYGQAAIFNAIPKYIDNPRAPSNFSVEVNEDYSNVTINWVNPTHSVAGKKLTGDLDVYVLKNNDTIYNTIAAVGDTMQFIDTDITTYGNFTYSVFANNDTLQGFPAKTTIFVGPNCDITISMLDTWNDGWKDAAIIITNDNEDVYATITMEEGSSPKSVTVPVAPGRVHFTWQQSSEQEGYYDKECAFTIYDAGDAAIYEHKMNNPLPSGKFLSFDLLNDCSPTNINYYGVESYNNEVFIYPNPADDEFIIRSEKEIYKLQIFNEVGRLVTSIENCNNVKLSTQNFSQGVYIVKIFYNNDIYITKKLMIK